MSSDRALLRHTLATLAYRAAKALRDAPPEFASYDGAGRTPIEIVAHIGDLMEWGLSMANGTRKWHETEPGSWDAECGRFFAALKSFDDFLASDAPIGCDVNRLFQGPIADSLTHVGQIAMLRRIAGTPMRGESYYRAEIVAGRVGAEQTAPRREFD